MKKLTKRLSSIFSRKKEKPSPGKKKAQAPAEPSATRKPPSASKPSPTAARPTSGKLLTAEGWRRLMMQRGKKIS